MKKSSKRLIAGAVVLLVAAGFVFKLVSSKEEAPQYETRPTVAVQTPVTGDITLYTELTGTVEPVSRASVMPKISGEILEVNFQAGDTVQAGQVLCKIDSDALRTMELQMQSASVAADTAARELARLQPLFDGGFVSQQQFQQAQDAATSARLAYETAKTQYDLQMEYTTVTAPIGGVIESRGIELHDHVSPSAPICVISGGDQLQVNFGVTEKVMKNMNVGDALTVEKNGSTYEGNLTEIGAMVNASGLYDAKAAVSQGASLTNGAKVKLTVVMDRAEGAMTVPVDAVNYDDGQAFVYCYEDGTAKKTMVEAGIYDSQNMEIISGLEADSQVIVTWSNELVDGQQVLLDDGQKEESSEGNADQETSAAESEKAGE
ncbi:efflux RND transporter periplasmic adaptor subunit [Enterocloster sp.]|uniref:efflux RND transporter periplasmic adaptor subunit n=1 Tax=Enterocloster sp. TaxID=2719315 RepID=UPI003AF160DC